MNPLYLLEKMAESFYPYRRYFVIFGIAVIAILSVIVKITGSIEGYTLGKALYFTFAIIGGNSLFIGVIAIELDPEHSNLKVEKDDGWFSKSYNIFMKTFISLVYIFFVFLSIVIVSNAWFPFL